MTAFAPTPAHAATVVTNCNDSGTGSLRDAVTTAPANTPTTITFMQDCTGGSKIVFSTSTITISNNVTIDATGHTVTLDGGRAKRLFIVGSGWSLTLTGLTLQNGFAGLDSNTGMGYTGYGGGAINFGTLIVTNCTFTGNYAPNGGALENNGTLTMVNSTFTGNSAGSGGALYNTTTGIATITGSTIAQNGANIAGGINNGGTLTVTLSVLAGNTSSSGATDLAGTVTTDGGGNVVGKTDGSTGLTAPTDRTGTTTSPLDPLLAPLGSYGGTVQTVAPLPGSPAFDIAACSLATPTLSTDARGVARPQPVGGLCDAGAFESRGFTLSAVTGSTPQSAAVGTAFTNTLAVQLVANDPGVPVSTSATPSACPSPSR